MIPMGFTNWIDYKIVQKVFNYNGLPPRPQSSREVRSKMIRLRCNAESAAEKESRLHEFHLKLL